MLSSLDQGAWSSVGDPQSWRPVSSRNHWEFGIASTKESQIFRSIPCEWLLLQHSSENLGHLVWVVWFSRWRFGITAASKLTLLLGNVVQTVALKPCNHQDTFALPEPRRCRWTRYKKLYKDDQRWSNTSNPQNADHLQQFSHDTFPIDRPCNLISRTIPALAQCSDDMKKLSHVTRHDAPSMHWFVSISCWQCQARHPLQQGRLPYDVEKHVRSLQSSKPQAICAWLDLGNFIAMRQDHRCVASYQQVPCQGEGPSWPGQPRMTQEL